MLSFGSGSYAPPVEVDTVFAEGESFSLPELEVQVEYLAPATTSASVEIPSVAFSQFRVDYDLGLDAEVPFYANVISERVEQGGYTSVRIRAVGVDQVRWVNSRFAGAPVGGIATLTLAGYDSDDNVVLVDTLFDIAFADY
ncbi:MAG: hypothetical protein JXX28_17025 [Deltaproteobacteria bacterium]|nr:hypothetical protein [Deltaproteobacteria bacterium]